MAVVVDPRLTGSSASHIGSMTCASLVASFPAASWSGYTAFASDLGPNGTLVQSNGTRWRPVNGRTVLKSMGPGSAVNNSESLVVQALVPAIMAVGDVLAVIFATTKTGTTDSGNFVVRIGTAGTTADTTVVTGNNSFIAAAVVNADVWSEFIIASATTVQRLGAQAGAAYLAGSSASATQAATTIPNISNALYVSLGIVSSGTTNTLALQHGRIELITP